MAKKRTKRSRALVVAEPTDADLILETTHEATLLDMLDKLLNKGVVASGDIVLGVAGVDLIYMRLSTLLCAIDRIMPDAPGRKRRHNRGPRRLRLPSE